MQPFDAENWRTLMRLIAADDGHAITDWLAGFPDLPASILFVTDPADELARTPLMLAYWQGKAAAATAIVNAGADYQQQDSSGNNCSWYARRFGKGAKEAHMARTIRSSARRISMEKAISQEIDSESDKRSEGQGTPPKRRTRDV